MNATTSLIGALTRVVRLMLCAWVYCLAGCNLWHLAERPAAESTSLPGSPAAAPSHGEGPALERLLACSGEVRRADGTSVKEPSEGWFLSLAPPERGASVSPPESAGERQFRWRHAGLDRWLALPTLKRADLSLAVASSNRGVAAAAVIGLARSGKQEFADQLAALAADSTLAVPTRRAAIETLSHLEDAASTGRFTSLCKQLTARDTPAQKSNYSPQLHAELLHGLARRPGFSADARFVSALGDANSDVRLAASEILAARAEEPFPDAALKLLDDPEPRVRVAALKGAAVHGTAAALPAALAAARHPEPDMRLAAIGALSAIGGEKAQEELRQQARREAEIFQEAAIAGLARLKDFSAVYEAAGDKSFRVRRAVAAALADEAQGEAATPEAIAVARKLLTDQSSQVQQRTIQSLGSWPLSQAGPLLLAGLESSSYTTRQGALAALARRWPPAAAVNPQELQPLATHHVHVERLKKAWASEFGGPVQAVAADRVPAKQAARENPLRPGAAEKDDGSPAQPDVASLRQRLGNSDKHARIEAALALARLGEKSGVNVLESLTYDPDPQLRCAAAASIGELADERFVPTLIKLLDDLPAVRLAALKALQQSVARDIARDGQPPPRNSAEEAQRWKDWHAQGGKSDRSDLPP